jgi:hypothetical protein
MQTPPSMIYSASKAILRDTDVFRLFKDVYWSSSHSSKPFRFASDFFLAAVIQSEAEAEEESFYLLSEREAYPALYKAALLCPCSSFPHPITRPLLSTFHTNIPID